MENTFLIIDDDVGSCKALEALIRENNLGRIVCTLHSGESAVNEVLFYQPDVVITAMMLPVTNGITVARQILTSGFSGKIVMMSYSSNTEMITSAYEAGILFFLSKPLNHVEAVSVLRTAAEIVALNKAISEIKSTVLTLPDPLLPQRKSVEEQLSDIFRDLGLLGTAGTDDIQSVLLKIISHKNTSHAPYQLRDIYSSICQSRGKPGEAAQRALEQRIRRTIQKALSTVAQIGCADYYDSLFTEYASLLFDLRQVQQEIKHIRNPRENQGKINTKKFLEGILCKINI